MDMKFFSLDFVLLCDGTTFPANSNNCKHFLCYFNAVVVYLPSMISRNK